MAGYLAEAPAGDYWISPLVKLTLSSHDLISDSRHRLGFPGMVGFGNGHENEDGMRSGVLQK
jgi:hypothetical protein